MNHNRTTEDVNSARKRLDKTAVLIIARKLWLRGERVDISALAQLSGLGRATLFRWFESREKLQGEIIWSVYAPLLDELEQNAEKLGQGPEQILAMCARLIERIRRFGPLGAFLQRDPEQAIRLLTSKASPIQARSIAWLQARLDAQTRAGHLSSSLSNDVLAYAIVRLIEAFLYGRFVADRDDDPQVALSVIAALLVSRETVTRVPDHRL